MSLFPLLEIISVQLSVYTIIIMEIKAVELYFLDTPQPVYCKN